MTCRQQLTNSVFKFVEFYVLFENLLIEVLDDLTDMDQMVVERSRFTRSQQRDWNNDNDGTNAIKLILKLTRMTN